MGRLPRQSREGPLPETWRRGKPRGLNHDGQQRLNAWETASQNQMVFIEPAMPKSVDKHIQFDRHTENQVPFLAWEVHHVIRHRANAVD